MGRADDTMNLGGIKVSSRELEAVLNTHEGVTVTAAVAVQPEGRGDKLVVYAIVEEGLGTLELMTALSRLLATQLNPLYKIHDLVLVDELPRTASNKIMHRVLRDRYVKECAGEGESLDLSG